MAIKQLINASVIAIALAAIVKPPAAEAAVGDNYISYFQGGDGYFYVQISVMDGNGFLNYSYACEQTTSDWNPDIVKNSAQYLSAFNNGTRVTVWTDGWSSGGAQHCSAIGMYR
jgi:hypothetical protein